jgi:hypothetical protein
MKVQKAWSLKLHPTGISVCAVDRADIIFSLKTDLEIHSERFSQFLEHLGADMQKRITELCIVEPDESQPDHIQRGISWPPLPWSNLLQYIPNITSLRLNDARFDTLFKANANLVYRYLSVLHLHDMDLLDIHAATDLNQALKARTSRYSACTPIREIRLSADCQLSTLARNSLGADVAVFFDGEEIEYDLDGPLLTWGT